MQEATSSPKFVVIGGGSGSFTMLRQLKAYVRDITALVNMADDGGSTGVLRDELGVLPPGDVRQCLVALSDSSHELRELFNYRFPAESTFAGHSFGNLFLSAVEKMTDNFGDAVQLAGEVLNISGRVLPMTLDNCQLVMKLPSGKTVTGEYAINQHPAKSLKKAKLYFKNKARINPLAEQAIHEADVVVIAPGNLYASLIPALIVQGVPEALQKTSAKVVYVCNLVNKPQHTFGYAVHDYVNELERFIGPGAIDYVLYNTDKPPAELLEKYALEGEHLVRVNQRLLAKKPRLIAKPGNFLSRGHHERNPNDTFIHRSLIRHDSDAVARALMRIYFT